MAKEKEKKIVKRRGKKEEFKERKLYASIYYPARVHEYSEKEAEELASEVCEEVIEELDESEDNVFTSDEIRDITIKKLKKRDKDVAFLYETHLDVN